MPHSTHATMTMADVHSAARARGYAGVIVLGSNL